MSALKISDYGLIGNTRTAALVSKEGSIDWCCFPRFDSSGFFSRLLDENGGHMQICPATEFVSEQRYLDDTNVLETVFTTKTGEVRLLDCFPVDEEESKHHELSPTHEILRVIEGVSGTMEMKYSYFPKPEFGKSPFRMRNAGRLGLRCEYGINCVVLNHDLQSNLSIFKIAAGEKRIFSLCYNSVAPGVLPTLGESALMRLDRTINYWRSWIAQCQYRGEHEKDVRRSALTLKLLVYSPSGAIIAAPTTSLPEEILGERNWDYRYCWLRDASFTIHALLGLGFQDEAKAYMSWILHSTALTRPRLQVLYSVYGDSKIPEEEISRFNGFKNSRPVRIGNAADSQFQLDVYGEVMNAVYIFSFYMKNFDRDTISFLKGLADTVCELWDKPDKGIWEIRSGHLHHTHSKFMAFIALDRFVKLAQRYNWKIDLEKYLNLSRLIKEEIEEHGYNQKIKSYTLAYDSDELDASLLTLPILEKNWNRNHVQSTIFKILDNLTKNGLTYRYLHRKDGVRGGEGAFGACSFWLVENLAILGHKEHAKKLMNDLIKKQNSLGLWPEEMDPNNCEYLGNYPQAFTHTALIGAALRLQEKFP